MKIGDKMFAYIQNHENLTTQMVQEYKNSMIFLGDQQQIYVPVINSYVGIGQDAYSYLLSKLNDGNDNLNNLYDYVNNNSVTSIYAQYSPEDIATYLYGKQITISPSIVVNNYSDSGVDVNDRVLTGDTTPRWLQAKRNVVIRGINNDDQILSNSISSGIKVKIEHQGISYLYGTIDGHYYSYFNPEHDIISIDDSYTWSYITELNSYLINFTSAFSSQQANRIYADILGLSGTTLIEKETNEVILFNENGNNSLIGDVYVRVNSSVDPTNTDTTNIKRDNNWKYAPVKISDDNSYIQTLINGNWINIYNLSTDNDVATDNTTNGTWENIVNYLQTVENGGYDQITNGGGDEIKRIPVWYNLDTASTSTYNENLADGVNTIKEVAYILDKITDGSDGGYDTGIQIAYNIAKNNDRITDLENWKDNIGDAAVQSFKSESNNDYLSVSYYSVKSWKNDQDERVSGDVNLDINLLIAQTYSTGSSTYAAYLSEHYNLLGNNKKYAYYITNNDDYYKNYISLSEATTIIDQIVSVYGISNPIQLYKFINNVYTEDTGQIATIDYDSSNNTYSLTGATDTNYIYWPYRKYNNTINTNSNILNGLTTVEWVTSYVGWSNYELDNKIKEINVNSDIEDYVKEHLHSYSNTDNAYTYYVINGNTTETHHQANSYAGNENGLFVTSVTESNGVIKVVKEKLPLDKILTGNVYTTNDILIPISDEQAASIPKADYINLYGIDNTDNVFEQLNTQSTLSNYHGLKYKLSDLSSFTEATGTVTTLLENLGQVSYFYKIANNGTTQYIPLDIQEEYTINSHNVFNGESINPGTTYYLSGGAFNKYIEAFTYHNADGSTSTTVTSYITYLNAASETRTGLADAWDVRRTIESMFTWVDLETNTVINGQ